MVTFRARVNGYLKWIIAIISIVGMITGTILWAAEEHSDIKDWALEKNTIQRSEVIETIKNYYMPRSDFTHVTATLEIQEQGIAKIEDNVKEIKTDMKSLKEDFKSDMKDIEKKTDNIYRLLLRQSD